MHDTGLGPTCLFALTAALGCYGPDKMDTFEVEATVGSSGSPDPGSSGTGAHELEILEISPADGAAGVLEGTRISIDFSVPMDQASVRDALRPIGFELDETGLAWNPEGDRLAIAVPIAYPEGALSQPPEPMVYGFELDGAARSRDGATLGEPIAATFTSARRLTAAVPIDPSRTGWASGAATGTDVRAGDLEDGEAVFGFASFNLADLPPDVIVFEQAALRLGRIEAIFGDPFDGLGGAIESAHVTYLSLGPTAIDVPPLRSYGTVATSPSDSIDLDVLEAVAEDYDKRDVRGSRTQFRFAFPLESDDDGAHDLVQFGDLAIDLRFLIP